MKRARVDLHVHSRFSEGRSTWLHRYADTPECLTSPEEIRRESQRRGMDFVTITDHDTIRGALELKERHPKKTIVGVELTSFFPEDGTKVHVLVWGIDEAQWARLEALRNDLYAVRDFLVAGRIAHSLAHATFDMDGKLRPSHLEKLVLLFDVFETVNGGRRAASNTEWRRFLECLSPDRIEELRTRHRIEPSSSDPWIKGMTGGSDDHGGLFIGETFTEAEASTPEEFLAAIREKRTKGLGLSSDPRRYSWMVARILQEQSTARKSPSSATALGQMAHYLFTGEKISWTGKFKVRKFREKLLEKGDVVSLAMERLVGTLKDVHDKPVEVRLEKTFAPLAHLVDAWLSRTLDGLLVHGRSGNVGEMFTGLGSAFHAAAGLAPLAACGAFLNGDRELVSWLRSRNGRGERRILWVSDTFDDLNGVSETLRGLGKAAHLAGRRLTLAVPEQEGAPSRPNVVRLPVARRIPLPFYEGVPLKIPSLLPALEKLLAEEVDEIFISTPGPFGWLGLLAARIKGVPATGIFHTDFGAQVAKLDAEAVPSRLVDAGLKWFYGRMETVRAPSTATRNLLLSWGLPGEKLKGFPRGLDAELFRPLKEANREVRERHDLSEDPILLYTGRVSKDKNLGLLLDAFRRLVAGGERVQLLMVGEGPMQEEIRDAIQTHPETRWRIRLLGRLPREELPLYYSGCDLFVFPSATDTFGLSVLEAQACGLPALVGPIGGPSEIVENEATGWVVEKEDAAAWERTISDRLAMKRDLPVEWEAIRSRARERVLRNHDFRRVFADFFQDREGIEEASGVLPVETTP